MYDDVEREARHDWLDQRPTTSWWDLAVAYDDQVWNEILSGVRQEVEEDDQADEIANEMDDTTRDERLRDDEP